jgi:hypothetical protein
MGLEEEASERIRLRKGISVAGELEDGSGALRRRAGRQFGGEGCGEE